MYRKMLLSLGAFALLPLTAQADVTVTQDVKLEGMGMLSMFGTSGHVTSKVSGDKAYTENQMEAKSGMLQKAMQNHSNTQIIRLDRDLAWMLVPAKQRYSEKTLDQMRAEAQKSMEEMKQNSQQGMGMPVNSEDCEWSPATVAVSRTGEVQHIAGEKAEEAQVTVSQTCTDPKTGHTCEVAWVMDSWLAKNVLGGDEMRNFYTAFTQRLGLDEMPEGMEMSGFGQALLAMYSEGMDDVSAELQQLKGYPMKFSLQVEMGGNQCVTNSGQPIALDSVWEDAAMAGVQAGAYTAGSAAASGAATAAAGSAGSGVAGSVAGSAAGAATSAAISGLFKKWGKKKQEQQAEEQAAAAQQAANQPQPTADSRVVLFRISSEITGISAAPIQASTFEVPDGWKKEK